MKHTGIAILLLALLAGCASRDSKPVRKPIIHVKQAPTPLPPAPKKNLKLKEVDDNNFNDKYMYPEDSVKKETAETPVTKTATIETPTVENPSVPTPVATTGAMTKGECIAMISQEKFDKYSQMFGNENASIKRCAMLKAMNK